MKLTKTTPLFPLEGVQLFTILVFTYAQNSQVAKDINSNLDILQTKTKRTFL